MNLFTERITMQIQLNRTINVLSGLTTAISTIKSKTDTLITQQNYITLFEKIEELSALLSGNFNTDIPETPETPEEPSEPEDTTPKFPEKVIFSNSAWNYMDGEYIRSSGVVTYDGIQYPIYEKDGATNIQIKLNRNKGTWELIDLEQMGGTTLYYTNTDSLSDRWYLWVSGDDSIIPTIELVY